MTIQKTIDHSYFTLIPRFRAIISTLPDQLRICPRHGEEVRIQESDFVPSPSCVAPFKKADWVGCCKEAIDRVIDRVQRTLAQIDLAKQRYRDELAPKLEPEHVGEIVAIELGTNDYFIGEDEIEAADKARAAGHEGSLFFLRVGSPYAHRVMSPRR
jgi:hypothetical protein